MMKFAHALPLAMLVFITGCSNPDMKDLRGFIEEVKQRPPSRIEPLPEIPEIQTHAYSSQDLRNPFAPEAVEEEETTVAQSSGLMPDFNRRKEELEAFPLDSLRMVGTLEQQNAFWALIKTSESTVHMVKAGNYLGLNYGKINRITEDKIELTEIIKDGQGGYIERQADVALAATE